MKLHIANVDHEQLYQELVELMRRYEHLPKLEMLAIAANILGKLVALQDQRVVTPSMAMKVVALNLEEGNRQVLAQLSRSDGSA